MRVTVPLGLLAGFVLAFTVVRVARSKGPGAAVRIYALALVVAALVYVAFALVGGASPRWLALEGLGVVFFGATAWIGLRSWPGLLAVGWGAHVAWDVLLHVGGAGAAYTPAVYPWLCVSFDIVIAGAVLAAARERTPSRAHQAHDER